MSTLSQVTKLVLEDVFMIRSVKNVTSFWFKGLPRQLHFSISHRPGDAYFNLHIDKNMQDNRNKPKIGICKIATQGLTEDLTELLRYVIFKLLEPIPMQLNKTKSRKHPIYFINYNEVQNGKGFYRLRRSLTETFKQCSQLKGKKELRIKKNFESEFTSWANNRVKRNWILSGLRKLPRRFSPCIKSGVVITPTECTCVMVIKNRLYKIKQEIEAIEVLKELIAPELLTELIHRINFAIPRVLVADNYQQVQRWDNAKEIFIIKK